MKGLGDSRSPLYFVGIAAAVNIVLEVLLVGPFGMGTKGAAYATVFSQGISLIASCIHFKRRKFIPGIKLNRFSIKKDTLAAILKIGLPTAIQMVVVNISYLLVTAMAGQNIGAKNMERVKETTKTGLLLNLVITFIVMLLVQIFAEPIIKLFDPASADVIANGIVYLRICCGLNSVIYAVMYTFDSFAIGAGSAHIAMLNALLDAVIVRLPVSWLLAFPFAFGFSGIYLGQALSPILPAVVGLLYFKSKRWQNKNPARRK